MCVCTFLRRDDGGEGAGGEWGGGRGYTGGVGQDRRAAEEGGFRWRNGGARRRMDRRGRRETVEPRVGSRPPAQPPHLLLRLQQRSIQYLR